jgi:hypothetical protein
MPLISPAGADVGTLRNADGSYAYATVGYADDDLRRQQQPAHGYTELSNGVQAQSIYKSA